MKRTMKVTGRGRVSVKPDLVRLMITQSEIKMDYEEAVKRSTEAKKELTGLLGMCGFQAEQLKTLHFSVDTEHVSEQDEHGIWRQRFAGYRFRHEMKLEFPVDGKVLGKALYQIARCPGEPEFSIEYTTSNPEAARDELLQNAVADAGRKARVLAEAAGVTLGQLVTIDYSFGEIEIVARPMNAMLLRDGTMAKGISEASYDMPIEANDINLTDTVTVIWSIQ